MNPHSDLGRAEVLLRAMGLSVWIFVGAPAIYGLAAAHALTPIPTWVWVWSTFGLAFAATTIRRLPRAALMALLAVQTASALALPWVGHGGSEGLMLSVVTAEVATILTLRASVVWAVGQALAVFIDVYPLQAAIHIVHILGAYSAFSIFALAAMYLREREVLARRELGRVNAELIAAQGLLAESSRASERVRISRELHDTLGHHLAAMSIQLELASRLADGKAADAVRESHATSRRLLSEVRSVVSTMRDVGTIDLASAVKLLASVIPEPKIHCDIAPSLTIRDSRRAHALFRCAQEAITNAVKHARARNVWIEISECEGAIDLFARDDGCGVGDIRYGGGLSGMRERAAELGARLRLASVPGHGFEVRVTFPREDESP